MAPSRHIRSADKPNVGFPRLPGAEMDCQKVLTTSTTIDWFF